MTIAIVILMLLGYVLICTEHITHINKATVALFCGVCGLTYAVVYKMWKDL